MDILAYLENHTLLLDGAMGSMLYARGLSRDERSESWDLTHPEVVKSIHKAYYDAGSNLVLTNTFGANGLYHDDAELEKIITAAVGIAQAAAEESGAPQEKFVALDIGPCGRLIDPLGDLPFDRAAELYGRIARLGAAAGADLVFIETMYDLTETRAALTGAKENCALPVFVSNTYGEAGP